jgi:hypothetical protein
VKFTDEGQFYMKLIWAKGKFTKVWKDSNNAMEDASSWIVKIFKSSAFGSKSCVTKFLEFHLSYIGSLSRQRDRNQHSDRLKPANRLLPKGALPHDMARPHAAAHTIQTIRNLTLEVRQPATVETWLSVSRFSPFWSTKRSITMSEILRWWWNGRRAAKAQLETFCPDVVRNLKTGDPDAMKRRRQKVLLTAEWLFCPNL